MPATEELRKVRKEQQPDRPLPMAFQNLVRARRRLILFCSLFALAFYLAQIALSVFSTVLDGFALGPFTWGWLYALAQFLVPLAVLHFYQMRSAALDVEAALMKIEADD